MEYRTFDQEYERATRAATRADRIEPRAKSARYDRRTNRIVVELRNGATFMFPAELAQGLSVASPKELAEVQVTPSGAGLRWTNLDVDFSLPNLLAGQFGSKSWMAKQAAMTELKFETKNRQKLEAAGDRKLSNPAQPSVAAGETVRISIVNRAFVGNS